MTLGERIKQRRLKLGMRQETLAVIAGVTQAQISRYESNDQEPTASTVAALADALQTSTDWLLGMTENDSIIKMDDLSALERQAIAILRTKSPDRQSAILDILRLTQ